MTQKQLSIFKRRFRQNFQQRMGGFKLSFPWFFDSIVGPGQEATVGKGELVSPRINRGLPKKRITLQF